MNEGIIINDVNELKKQFQSPRKETALSIYLPVNGDEELSEVDKLSRLFGEYKKSGYGGVIPFVPAESTVVPFSEQYYLIYGAIAEAANRQGLSLGYLDDTYMMREYLLDHDENRCRVLAKHTTSCTSGETAKIKRRLTGELMSAVAVNDDDLTILDLREFVGEEFIQWDVPEGNWNVEQYVCEPDKDAHYIDLFDYEISIDYLKCTLKLLIDRLEVSIPEIGGVRPGIDLYIYKNISYCGQNRRIWHTSFNRVFEETYGFDPATLYPLMFRDFGGHAKRFKAMMMACRSKIFNDGFLKAVADYCKTKNIFCTGYPEEAKSVSCSWMFGDGQQYHQYASAPGCAMPFAYLYGINGIKVASGAADVFGSEIVAADIFKHYRRLNKEILYKEAMNSYVRGVNMLFAHLGEDRHKAESDLSEGDGGSLFGGLLRWGSDDLSEFSDFTSRVQTMLRGGEHVSEVAIVYPIHTIHAMSYLYEAQVNGFEYANTSENEDYMEVMNSFLNYVGIDASFIHPTAIGSKCFAEGGTLYMDNGKHVMKFRLLVLPSMSVISLKTLRMIRKFFDEGGKIIATDNLPTMAVEYSDVTMDLNKALKNQTEEDKEVHELLTYIFGSDCQNAKIIKNYYANTNEAGGAAYFFPSNKTTVDGTDSVSATILYQAVGKFRFAPDVYVDRMPRLEFSGIVNYHLPTFEKINVAGRLTKGCSMNYIHKRYAGAEIYYITNTTGEDYRGNILLRGRHQPEEWNPYSGKTKKTVYEYVRFRGEVYTKVNTTIEAGTCVFFTSATSRSQKDIVKELSAQSPTEQLKEYFAWENF